MFRFERERLLERSGSVFAVEYPIRFQEVDAAGIIFYPRVLEICHDAFVEFLASIGFPLADTLKGSWIMPVRHAEADYLRPLRFGDRIEVALVAAQTVQRQPPTEVTLGYRLANLETGHPSAVAQTVHTFVDRRTFERVPIPEGLERAFKELGR
jgi:YbgC/YbaW family acyl-CoA thioester hydrolase